MNNSEVIATLENHIHNLDQDSDSLWVVKALQEAVAALKPVWTTEWPKEPGKYWFSGKMFDNDVDLCLVSAVQSKNSIVYIAEGAFLYPSEKCHSGIWCVAKLPELPKA